MDFRPTDIASMVIRRTYMIDKCSSSMQLTRAADYGVRVMIYMASQPDDARKLLPALALFTGTPVSFLSKVMQALGRAGMVASRRGKSGGFALLPRGREASLYDVVEAIEGPVCLNVCLVDGKDCERVEHCPAHPVWARAQRAMLHVLKNTSIAEMATQTTARKVPEPGAKFETPFTRMTT